jgi:hypothetical protein
MPEPVRLPISNVLTGGTYTAPLVVGAGAVRLNMLLDTGSSTLAVDGGYYDPGSDGDAQTTRYLQATHYGSTSFAGAVVRTNVTLAPGGGAPSVTLAGVNLAVTYGGRRQSFNQAQGIFGLAYQALNNAYLMPADTWQNQYDADQVNLGQEADLAPYFDQLTQAGLIGNQFAFLVKRAMASAALDDASADSLNQGIFVLGGGADCTDLYAGEFVPVAVVHEQYYNTNLLSVQVGSQPAINVAPVAPGRAAASNSIVDSGTNTLLLDQDLYDRIIAAFKAIRSDFAHALTDYAVNRGQTCDQAALVLADWPELLFGLQGRDRGTVVLSVAPADYWQFDAGTKGQAAAVLCGDGGMLGGQSILGLPLFCSRFVVFDRSASSGHGAILFAGQALVS